jgi:hypothetical protein
MSMSSQMRFDDFKRKKDLENLLETHIESLRGSSGSGSNGGGDRQFN